MRLVEMPLTLLPIVVMPRSRGDWKHWAIWMFRAAQIVLDKNLEVHQYT